MEKYGYKNISSRTEFEKASKSNGKFNTPIPQNKNLTIYNFVDWTTQGDWGMPGQTRYFVKDVEDLVKASEKMTKPITGKRKPNGYVGW